MVKKFIIDQFAFDISSLGGNYLFGILIIFSFFLDQALAVKLAIFLVLANVAGYGIKAVHFTTRPDGSKREGNILERIDASSFPSIHSARAIGLAYYFAFITAFSWLVALGICWSRVHKKRHYWTDVAGGVVLGALCIFVTFLLFPFVFEMCSPLFARFFG